MSIKADWWPPEALEADLQLTVTGSSLKVFKDLVRRALNCWPEAHPELKELGDILDHGRILQDYWASRTDISGKVRHPDLPSAG